MEEKKPHPSQKTAPRKPAKAGVPKLSNITLLSDCIDISRIQKENAERTMEPEFILRVSLRDPVNSLPNWNLGESSLLVKMFGQKGGVTNNSVVFSKWQEKGVPSFDEYVRDKVCKYILNNPRIETYWANHETHVLQKVKNSELLLRFIYTNKVLSKEFGVTSPLTQEDKDYLLLWDRLHVRVGGSNEEVHKVRQWLNSIPPTQNVKTLIKKLQGSYIHLLDVSAFRAAINTAPPDKLPKYLAIFKTLLNS